MNFRDFFLGLSVLIFLHMVALFCIFHDRIVQINLQTSTSISTANPVSDQETIIGELELMWQEKLIEDLFRGSTVSLTLTGEMGKVEKATSAQRRKHTISPSPREEKEQEDVVKPVVDVRRDELDKKPLKPEKGEFETSNDELGHAVENTVQTLPPHHEVVIMEDEDATFRGKPVTPESIGRKVEGEVRVGIEATEAEPTRERDPAVTREEEEEEDEEVVEIVRDDKDHTTTADTLISDMAYNERVSAEQAKRVNEAKELKEAIVQAIKNSENNEEQTVTGENSRPERDSPKMVLILTESRHGSTWVMDLLSYGDNAIPVFEPLNTNFLKMYALNKELREEYLALGFDPVKYSDWREVILARICLCDWHNRKIPGKTDRRFGSIVGLGYKSKRFDISYKDAYKESMDTCEKENSMLVPKTIRLYNITNLHLLSEFGCHNFKIIHLVRDPRAVLKSRMSVFHELYDGNKLLGEHIDSKLGQAGFNESYMRQAAGDLCSHHVYNWKIGMKPPAWLEGKYTMVRYEDLAESPERWARKLLRYVGVPYTNKYREYVYNTTHIKERGQKDKGWYSVDKESSEVVNSWKDKLIEPQWRLIENVCAEMMKVFGYKPDFLLSED